MHCDLTPDSANESLLQALRNLWPILSPQGRQQAIDTVEELKATKLTEVHWINKFGFCDGPHPELHDGKWRYPVGRTAIRKFIKSNGSINYELVCTTPGCRFHSSPIPNKAAEHLTKKLPVSDDRQSAPSTDTCCYIGCESTQVEWHHFAPYNTFGAEADRFPIMPLCRQHHTLWHTQMDGYRWRRPTA